MSNLNRELLKTSLLIIALLAVVLLSGCASDQVMPDPNYAPVYPKYQQDRQGNTGSIYNAQTSMDLYGTSNAKRVGDILTVVLQEKTDAKKEATNEGNRSSDISASMSAPVLLGKEYLTSNGEPVVSVSGGGDQDFTGESETEQSNELTGSISVMVVDELPGGNLVVRGEKIVTLNRGDEYIRLSGIVRKVDITPDNTVLSTKVANARIIYSGRGSTHNYNDQGWVSRFFASTLSPF